MTLAAASLSVTGCAHPHLDPGIAAFEANLAAHASATAALQKWCEQRGIAPGASIAVEFVTDGLRPRLLAALKALTALATTVFVACLAWYAFKQAQLQVGQGDQSNTLAIPIVYFWILLLIGLAASTLCALLLVARWLSAAFGTGKPR